MTRELCKIEPGKLSGQVIIPASKSMTQRAIFAAALAKGQSLINNALKCDDADAAIGAARVLGAEIESENQTLLITASKQPLSNELNCGEAGLSMRLLAAIAASYDFEFTIIGRGSLLTRPVDMIEEPLKALGVRVKSNKGRLPVTLHGPLKSGEIKIDGTLTSQFLSGLLMALPIVEGDSVIEVSNLKSKPYVQMTLDVLAAFGIKVEVGHSFSTFMIRGSQHYKSASYTVPADWSSAAFWLVAGTLSGPICLKGIRRAGLQADEAIFDLLTSIGAKLNEGSNEISVEPASCSSFNFDANDCPDLFPILATLASGCRGRSTIKGVSRLRHKESDRAKAIFEEFSKIGGVIEIDDDIMHIEGVQLRGGEVDSHNDHRIAMALAIAALNSSSSVCISRSGAVAKSYPEFFKDLNTLKGVS